MDKNKNFPFPNDHEASDDETGSDELLADENLRLPDGANILVRLHAVRAWLSRKLEEERIELGEAALDLQEMMREQVVETRPRRRMHQADTIQQHFEHAQKAITVAQQRLNAYE